MPTEPNLPDGCVAPPDNPSWSDAATDAELSIMAGLDACVFCRGAACDIVSDDGVKFEATGYLIVNATGHDVAEMDDAVRNAIMACVHQYDMRKGRADADARTLLLEV